MIQAVNVTKRFDEIVAVNKLSAQIREGSVFGLVGTNGAGKSTFLRMVSGILKPDEGEILLDEVGVFETVAAKQKFFYISDDAYYFSNASVKEMMQFYALAYPNFQKERFFKLLKGFELDANRKVNTFSKGMKKQLSILLALCAKTDYILCDETFDGLDPVMRQAVKSLFAEDMQERNLTPIIASHNLRELEDICDHVGLLHKGGILLSKELDAMKLDIHKLQCVFAEDKGEPDFSGFSILKKEKRGRLYTLTVRGGREQVKAEMEAQQPLFFELLPLSLEEIFISETEVVGYDIKKLIF
ncbi:MAG: ABC transporter ATP-binding protein [bacterium]|nr:ABC transporter ATP-binding protein [bacterium]